MSEISTQAAFDENQFHFFELRKVSCIVVIFKFYKGYYFFNEL